MNDSRASDARPRSAVSTGVGLAGLAGFALFYLAVRIAHLEAPWVPLAGLAACALPMIAWSLAVDRVHRNPSTGIDWDGPPRGWADALDTGLVKLAGLWTTWGLIACVYAIGRWYWFNGYLYAMHVMAAALVPLVLLSIPYVLWLERRLVDREDGAWAFGHWLLAGGRTVDPALSPKIANHLRSWAIKGFFSAFMFSALPGNWANAIDIDPTTIVGNVIPLSEGLIALMFLIDVSMGTVGYILTLRPLDAHIRTGNPFAQAWMAALICYPPFILMNPGGPLDYAPGQLGWSRALADHPIVQPAFGILLVLLTGAYAWATVAFGLRFSNLTHRGILTHGPYRFTKHPAYVAKNIFWWFAALPMLTTTGLTSDALRNCCILAIINGVYVWRARTEEKHLSADPAYVEYAAWIARHGMLATARRAVGLRRRERVVAPAE